MQTLSENATTILDRMETDRAYEAAELREFVPGSTSETVRETMHELWVNRQVERYGYSGWRRMPSTCAAGEVQDVVSVDCQSARGGAELGRTKENKAVKPEDLFDHDAFAGIFKQEG